MCNLSYNRRLQVEFSLFSIHQRCIDSLHTQPFNVIHSCHGAGRFCLAPDDLRGFSVVF